MLIEINCETHGSNQVELDNYQLARYKSIENAPYAVDDFKKDLKCSLCSREEKIGYLRELAKIPLRFEDCSFDNFDKTKEKEIVKSYADKFQELKKVGASLVLCGSTGRGKTHLSCALINKLIEDDLVKCIYAKAFDVLRDIKDTYSKSSNHNFSEVQKKYARIELLVIDEVGVQFGSDTEKQILFEIINERYENLLPTILVTNLSLVNLKEFAGDRVIDRMKEGGGKVIIFSGESQRGKR